MVNELAAHDPSSYSEEMAAVPPLYIFRFCEPDECFVQQRCWLQGVAGTLPAETPSCNHMELGHEDLEELRSCFAVACLPTSNQRGDRFWLAGHCASECNLVAELAHIIGQAEKNGRLRRD